MNTKEFGKLRMFVYKSGNQFIGVCLELNIIVWEKSQKDAVVHLLKASDGYLKTVLSENLPVSLLNEKVSLKYYLIYYTGLFINTVHKMRNFFSVEVPMVDGRYGIPVPA